MDRPKVCITLAGKSLQEDIDILNKYRKFVNLAELRVDCLKDEERTLVRKFPQMAKIPTILTIRRNVDGGQFSEGEANRTILFAKALAFGSDDKTKNFAYVDFEEDFRVSSLQDAAFVYGMKIIRSVHNMENPITNIKQKIENLSTSEYEIPKIAFMPHTLADVQRLFEEAQELKDSNHIVLAMGPLGLPSRILSYRLKNYLTFTSDSSPDSKISNLGHIDPETLVKTYRFNDIDENTSVYGITGWPLTATGSPAIHNKGYEVKNMNSVYIPVRAETFDEAFSFAKAIGIKGMSVTIPHKESARIKMDHTENSVKTIEACNTIVQKRDGWYGYNTDWSGFTRALIGFTGLKTLSGKNIAIIGAGGAAKAIAYAVKLLKGKACIFNRTLKRASSLAKIYGFKYASLGPESVKELRKYSDIIIQTTSKGMNCYPPKGKEFAPSTEDNDPIYFYPFKGHEIVFDIVYEPQTTPMLGRAKGVNCKTCNGQTMLDYQAYEQFELFTGASYNGTN